MQKMSRENVPQKVKFDQCFDRTKKYSAHFKKTIFRMTPPSQIAVRWAKMRTSSWEMAIFCFSQMVNLILFTIAYWTYCQNFKSFGALELHLSGLLYLHTFNIRISQEENAKCKKEQLILFIAVTPTKIWWEGVLFLLS